MAYDIDRSQAPAESGALPKDASPMAKALRLVRERGVGVGMEILVNFVLPYMIYSYGEQPWGQVPALMASSGPPIVWTLIGLARHRRLDALSILVLAGISLSLLAYLGGGSVRFLQLREKLVTVLIGLAFLGSVAIGHPLIYQLTRAGLRRSKSAELGQFEALKDNAGFRRTMTIMTLVWGTALVAEGALAGVLVFALSVRQYLIIGPAMGYVTFSAVGLWSLFYARSQRRKRLAGVREASALPA